ncbi:MAG TPA: hypothetical protein DCS82_10525 [Rhodospirillaceae bacterium]|nr:hypothetical protein [Rhodospirillaceae bacterium]HAT36142.1 hypothetical protein [Rhodospirillaceae bacterium]|tara:strand:+ start:177 stop:440 length:264 start_codon:yes stop_codon:yes gene_type:complete
MVEISTGSILNTNFFSVAPVARAAGGGEFVSAEANALNFASDNAGRNSAALSEGTTSTSPRFVAFDPTGRLVGSQVAERGSIVDVLA